jgi:hypothetical protein
MTFRIVDEATRSAQAGSDGSVNRRFTLLIQFDPLQAAAVGHPPLNDQGGLSGVRGAS